MYKSTLFIACALVLNTGVSYGASGASCIPNGSQSLSSTIVVDEGETFDGNCQVFNPTFGDGSQDEGQDPVFRVNNGGTLRNVIIGNNGADGIHTYGDVRIDNITWQNVGEDALTIKGSGTVYVSNIEGYEADDKFFQINAESTLRVDNCIIDNAGKALRQNGGTTFKIDVAFNNCLIKDMGEGVFRTDSSSSVARLSNSELVNARTVCIGPWASCEITGDDNSNSDWGSDDSGSDDSNGSSQGSGDNAITVRMSGVTGSESVSLQVGGTTLQSWTLNTSMNDYTVNTDASGDIRVVFTNDNGERDVQVDYIMVNGAVRQAEDQDDNTGAWGDSRCGGGTRSEWLHCNGSIGFGSVYAW
jgi:hypothetical protein